MRKAFEALHRFTRNPKDAPNVDHLPTTDATTTSMPGPSTVLPLTNPNYDVFISHAGEDKATIAIPLREKLMAQGITAFVDEEDIERGADAQQTMTDTMETASIAVIVLSPEFVARKWPIKELLCFLRRRKENSAGNLAVPVIIPFFYRLTIDDLYHEPRLDRRDKDGKRLYEKSRFFERMRNGEPEADIATIRAALQKLHGIMGVRNDFEASNESAHIMYRRRLVLLQDLLDKIQEAMLHIEPLRKNANIEERNGAGDAFHSYFDTTQDTSDLVFDFCYQDEESNACSQEARILHAVLDESQTENTSIAVRGIGGVGKTSLMRGISCLDRVKRRFTDGVYHMPLGKDGTMRDLIRELSKTVERSGGREQGESMRREENIENVLEGFRLCFEQRECLFILDDVWQTKEISASVIHELLRLHVSGKESKVLLTTRSTNIASWAGKYFDLEPRGTVDVESKSILLQYAGIKPENDEDHKAVDEILRRCSGLPLFLAVAGKAVRALRLPRGHEEHAAYRVYARKLRGNLQSMLTTGVALYERLDARLMISLDLMEERKHDFGFQVRLSIWEMYRRLSVLRKQSKVPMTMLKFLWELDEESQAAIIAGEFENVGLLDLEFEKRGSEYLELLRLHDSLYEFALMEARKHRDQRTGHEALLRGYGHSLTMREGCHEWWHSSLESDSYIHANLCRHLLAAGRTVELVYLLLSPQWAERQIKRNGVLFLEADFALGMTAAQDGMRDKSNEELSAVKEALWLISEAVTLSSAFISSNILELWFQVQGRLIGCCARNNTIRDYVARIETEGARPLILCNSSFLGEAGAVNARIAASIGSDVFCMAMMSDGDRIACGCLEGKIFVVNVKRSVVENQWIAHDRWVNAIAVGRDGTRLISCSVDNTAKVWEVETGHCVTSFTGHSACVNDVALMKDGKRVISVSADGTAIIWNVETGNIVSMLFTDYGSINCVALLGDEEELVMTGGNDRKLRKWNVTTGAQVGGTFDGHDGRVRCVAVTPDGRHVVSGSDDTTVRVWDVGSHKQLGSALEGHTNLVRCVGLSGDGRRLVSGSNDETIRVWDLETRTQICDPLEDHTSSVSGVSFLGDVDGRVISCSDDGTLRVWDVKRKNTRRWTNRHGRAVSSVSFTPDGRFVVSGSHDNTLHIWNTTSAQQIGGPLEGHSDYVSDVAVTPNGRCVVSVSVDETIRVWDLESRELLRTWTGNTTWIHCVAVTPQGDRVVTGSHDKTVHVWGLAPMNDSHVVLEGHSAPVRRVFVSDDGLRVVSVDFNRDIFVWDLEAKKLVKRFTKNNAWKLSRREVLKLVSEATAQGDTTLSIPLWGRRIVYGEGPDATVLATTESDMISWALSPDKKSICVGMHDGQVGFMKLET